MARVSADQVFELVSGNKLTVEQRAIVEESSLHEPTLVIAGAGSGKTELMMVRILYLVANSFARPDQVLGLTFTKKAAAELSSRVQQGLIKLRESNLWPQDLEEDFLPAKIVTYNSFGNEIFRSLALEIGFESDAKLITDAASTALAKELLDSASLSEYPALEDWQLTGGTLLS
ncbi:MAG: UvrD-helicase domain-containing protein, partial [Aquiluna sp.]